MVVRNGEGGEKRGREGERVRERARENERHKIQYLHVTIYEDCKQRAEEEIQMNLKEHCKSVKLWKPRAECSRNGMDLFCKMLLKD